MLSLNTRTLMQQLATTFKRAQSQTLPIASTSTQLTCRNYHPAERLPLDERQKKLYPQVEQEITDEVYPLLKFKPRGSNPIEPRPRRARRKDRQYKLIVREHTMSPTQDWPSVWPTQKTFVPSAIPLPIRQSYEEKANRVPRGKYANTELLKIPNFLHLTPEAIRRHCAALTKFCTKWPEGLDTDEQVRGHFPITFVTRDYSHSSSTIRDFRARVVEVKVNINDLKLDERARIKFIELADHRYDKQTEVVTITTDACPMKIQNQDYAEYLLSALYHESLEHQAWESERFDMEAFKNIDLDAYRETVEQKLGLNKR